MIEALDQKQQLEQGMDNLNVILRNARNRELMVSQISGDEYFLSNTKDLQIVAKEMVLLQKEHFYVKFLFLFKNSGPRQQHFIGVFIHSQLPLQFKKNQQPVNFILNSGEKKQVGFEFIFKTKFLRKLSCFLQFFQLSQEQMKQHGSNEMN